MNAELPRLFAEPSEAGVSEVVEMFKAQYFFAFHRPANPPAPGLS